MGLEGANSTEFDEQTPHPVIHIMEHQKLIKKKGGTMRLGAYPCVLKKGTKAYDAYQVDEISERHRHRFEFNNDYREQLEEHGLIISGTSPDGLLVEIVEIKDHPYMVASQFHPEFKSRPLKPHPLFDGFIKAVVQEKK
jgi:CTP synthase